MIQDAFYLSQGQVKPGAGVGEAQGTIHIAGAVHFDNPHAGMLLMIGAQTAVVRATMLYGSCILEWDRPLLVVLRGRSVCLGIRVNERFKNTVLRTAFPHENLILPQEYLGIDHTAAYWTNAASKFIENSICILLCTYLGFHALVEHKSFAPSGEIWLFRSCRGWNNYLTC